MKKFILAVVVVFTLACAGALEGLAPDPPFALPAESAVTGVNLNSNNGVNVTVLSYSVGSMDEVDLQADLQTKLVADGWTVNSTITGGSPYGTLTGTKDGESLAITVDAEGDGSKFELTWTR